MSCGDTGTERMAPAEDTQSAWIDAGSRQKSPCGVAMLAVGATVAPSERHAGRGARPTVQMPVANPAAANRREWVPSAART